MIKFIKQLFCNHYYKFDRLDKQHPSEKTWSIGHKTCKYCGKEKEVILKH